MTVGGRFLIEKNTASAKLESAEVWETMSGGGGQEIMTAGTNMVSTEATPKTSH